jgi:hypothetical protein
VRLRRIEHQIHTNIYSYTRGTTGCTGPSDSDEAA